MELSFYIGKQILSPAGDDLGYVKNVYLTRDRKKLSCLICIDGDEEEFYLPARAVLAADDVILAGGARLSSPTGAPCPVGLAAFSNEGQALGTVGDILLGEGEPVFVLVNDGKKEEVAAGRVRIGKTAIVYPEGAKRPAAAKKKSSTPRKKQNAQKTVPALPDANAGKTGTEENADKINTPEESAPQTDEIQTEAVNGLDRCNLLGRKVKISVFDGQGNPVALAGERVTTAILSAARRHNLLLRLTVNTLTNLC